MVKAIFAVAGGIAFVAFMLAIFAASGMLNHRKEGVSSAWFVWNGYAFFTGRNFDPKAEPMRRLFVLCAAAFFLALIVGAVFVVLYVNSAPVPPPA
ncbi:MAG: hypothetical protein JNL56_12805 [Alphaproteobacteria bacterium]|nr:hypothetical protein [Alphaproteobacteria bacterium]